jgi:hypothetical protein
MLSWFAILTVLLVAGSGDASLSTLNGETIVGDVTAWEDNVLTVAAPDGHRQLQADVLLEARFGATAARSADDRWVEFMDGSRLVYRSFTIANRVATFDLPLSAQPLKVPTERINRIEVATPSEALQKTLAEIERKQPAGDALVIAKRDEAAMDYLTGIVGDVTAEQISFQWDGERVPVKLSKAAAIVFYHATQAKFPDATCRVYLANGSIVVAREAELVQDLLHLRSAAGIEVDAPLSQLVRIDFSTGKIAYLSDLKPASVRWTPHIALPSEATTLAEYGVPRNNVSFGGSPLALVWDNEAAPSQRDVRTYDRGIAARSTSEIVYHVPQGMSRLQMIAGIDPATAEQGHVTLEIRGDDRILWEGTIDGRTPPTEIDVELGTARRLLILVGAGENLDFGDRLHLIEARFTK